MKLNDLRYLLLTFGGSLSRPGCSSASCCWSSPPCPPSQAQPSGRGPRTRPMIGRWRKYWPLIGCWPGTQTARCLRGRICHQLWRPQRDRIPGDLGWNRPECWIMMNCLCFVNSPDFNVQSLHLKIVSFLLADSQDSVLRIYRQKLHELFLLLPFSPFSPCSLILVITRDICQAQDNVTEFYNQRSGNHAQGVWRVTVLHSSLSTRSNHQHRRLFSDFCILHDPHFASRECLDYTLASDMNWIIFMRLVLIFDRTPAACGKCTNTIFQVFLLSFIIFIALK